MATLATMRARIADDLIRDDLTPQIASAITTAISVYQSERFLFNESRDVWFPTVASQEFYTAADNPHIPNLMAIDYAKCIANPVVTDLSRRDPSELETLSQSGTQGGEPYAYAYYDRKIRLYPIPTSNAWNIRLGAHITVAAPATDTEANNPWMTDAELLIRSRAKYELAVHVLKDGDLESKMVMAEKREFDRLKGRTNKLVSGGRVRAMNL